MFNMFRPFTTTRENVSNLYAMFFTIAFFKDKKAAEENLDVLFSLLNELCDVREWNRALESLAKAWETEAPKTHGDIVDVVQTKKNILMKINELIEDKTQRNIFDQADQGVRELYED